MTHKPGESCPCVCGDTCRGADCPCCAEMPAGGPCKCCCDVTCVAECECCCEQEMPMAMSGVAMRGGFTAASLAKPGVEPKWNVIFPRGVWHGPNFAKVGGSFAVDDGFMSEVLDNWTASGRPRIPVRWTHAHMEGEATPDQMRALDRKAGNVVDLRVTAAGLEGLTEWNKEGAADVTTGAFDGWSAEWFPKHVNRLTGEQRGWWLAGVALTNRPYFNTLPPVAASAHAESTDPTPHKEHRMSLRIAAILGLTANASEDAMVAALESKLKPTDTSALTAAVAAQEEKFTALTASLTKRDEQVNALTASLLERDVDAQVATAKRGDGKHGRAITDKHVARARKIASGEGLTASAEYLNELSLSVPLAPSGIEGDGSAVLSRESAQKKLTARAEVLRKEGVPDATLKAMAEMPDVALIASNPTTAQ